MVYRFAEFEIDANDFHFSIHGEPVQLEPKVLKLLIFFVENPNRLVRKQELLDALWPESSVTENALTRVIGLLRKTLGDDSQNPRFLHTVPTVGYRFVAQVHLVTSAAADTPADADVPSPSSIPAHRRWDAGMAMIALSLAVFAALTWQTIRQRSHRSASDPPPALLVLPLKNIGPAQDGYLADSITEELTTSLAQDRDLSVVSSTTARQLGLGNRSVKEIAVQARVDSVLEGSVFRQSGRARINLRLIDAAKDRQVWAQDLDLADSDLSALPRRVAREVVSALHLPAFAGSAAEPQRATGSAGAYDAYLQGVYFFREGAGSQPEKEWPKAAAALETAIRLDPDFGEPYALLARVHQMQAHLGLGDVTAHVQKANFLANKALTLNPRLPVAHDVLGQLHMEKAGDFSWEAAATEFKAAIKIDPGDPDPHGLLAALYMRTGLLDRAMNEIEIAYKLDPSFHYFPEMKEQILEYQQRYQEANDLCLQRSGKDRCVATLWESGRHDEAWSVLQKVVNDPHQRSQHESYDLEATEALMLAQRGEKKAAEKDIAQALRTPNRSGNTYFTYAEYNLGAAYAILNEDTKALELLESAAYNGLPCYPLFANDPELRSLRNNPEFVAFLERLRKQNEYFQKTL